MTTKSTEVIERPESAVNATTRRVCEPAADVIEKPDAIHLLIDLPGVDQKGLEVTIEEHTLRIRGKSAVTETRADAALHREFEPTDFERSFRLTTDLDEARISASLRNGLLRVTLPKAAKAKPRQIAVQTA